jgi:5-methylcytosine-specific restriction enzyme A
MARAKRPCTMPSCPNLSAGGPCPEHRAATYKEQDRQRGNRHVRGYGTRHDSWACYIKARDPICKLGHLRHPERPEASVVADHIVPLEDGGTFAFSNGQGLCRACHQWKTRIETDLRRKGRQHEARAMFGGGGVSQSL